MLFERLIQIKANIRHTASCFCYGFMYLISLSNAVNVLRSLFVLHVMIISYNCSAMLFWKVHSCENV